MPKAIKLEFAEAHSCNIQDQVQRVLRASRIREPGLAHWDIAATNGYLRRAASESMGMVHVTGTNTMLTYHSFLQAIHEIGTYVMFV